MTDEPATLDDVPQHLLATGPQRRTDAAMALFAAGYGFEMIDAAMALHRAIDQALAEHIRNEIPHLRGFTPEAACDRLVADIEQVRVALIGDA